MGTNYYAHKNACPTCGRGEAVHIGKSSCGWCFSLHIHPEDGIQNLDDWKREWSKPGVVIKDEYGKTVTPSDMEDCIACRAGHGRLTDAWLAENHAERGPHGLARHRIEPGRCVGHGTGTWDLLVGEFS
jgi:hypothetical protein